MLATFAILFLKSQSSACYCEKNLTKSCCLAVKIGAYTHIVCYLSLANS